MLCFFFCLLEWIDWEDWWNRSEAWTPEEVAEQDNISKDLKVIINGDMYEYQDLVTTFAPISAVMVKAKARCYVMNFGSKSASLEFIFHEQYTNGETNLGRGTVTLTVNDSGEIISNMAVNMRAVLFRRGMCSCK